MSVSARDVEAALKKVRYPGFTRDIVSFGVVRDLHVEQGRVRFEIALAPGSPAVAGPIEQAARAAVQALEGVASVDIKVSGGAAGSPALKMAATKPSAAQAGALDSSLIPEVKTTGRGAY